MVKKKADKQKLPAEKQIKDNLLLVPIGIKNAKAVDAFGGEGFARSYGS